MAITNVPTPKEIIEAINTSGPGASVWGQITGTLSNQTDLQSALDAKEDTISDLSTIRSGASAGATALQPSDVIDSTDSTATNKPLSANKGKELQDQIDNLNARGRFLALWNCSTGLAQTNPPESPYTYKAGDYFIVGVVAAVGQNNYKPSGSSYTTGVASSTVETDTVDVDDVYYYDGTNWKLQVNTQKTVSFTNIAGSPYDNSNLASALDAKISDVQINSTSIVSGGVASIPIVANNVSGLVTGDNGMRGINFSSNGNPYIVRAVDTEVTAKTSSFKPLTPANIDLAVKTGVTTNTLTLTTAEKETACAWLGAGQETVFVDWTD